MAAAALAAGASGSMGADEPATARVRHAPALEGRVEGSVQMMMGEDVALDRGAAVTGNLLVPGTPSVRVNGKASYGGTRDGAGASWPSRYTVTLEGGCALGHVIRRTDPACLPPVGAPPQPSGKRSVTVVRAGQSPGDFRTIRNLTLARNTGPCAVPAGAYGDFTARGGSSFVLGVAGAVVPSVYSFQNLAFEDGARMEVSGPVIITVARDFDAGGMMGAASHPAWLTLDLVTDGVALECGAVLYGDIRAPRGAVTVKCGATLAGSVACDRLIVGRGGLLRLVAANQPPTVSLTAPAGGAALVAFTPLTVQAAADDADGSIARVEFFDGATKLGDGTVAAGRPGVFFLTLTGGLPPGVHTLTAAATDDSGASTVSAPVVVSVAPAANAPPKVALTAPAAGSVLASGVSIALSASATDADGTVAKVEFFDGATKLGEAGRAEAPTYTLTLVSGLTPGNHTLTARATDNAGAFSDSAPVPVTVLASLPFLADFEAAEGYTPGSLAGQLGWRVSQGSAVVTGEASYSGTYSVALPPGAPPAGIAQTFAPLAGQGVIFADFFAQPVADADLGSAAMFDGEGCRFAFLRSGANGELHAFDGDGAKGGQWRTTAFFAPLADDGRTRNWIRLTERLDFRRHAWDLYADGRMVAADIGFFDSGSTALTTFGLQGHAAAPTRFDYFLAGPQNPLFSDVNDNGIDDAWETAHGLSLSGANRDLSPSGNGVTVVRAYIAGLDPQDYYCGVAPVLRWEGANRQVRRPGGPVVLPMAVAIFDAANGNPLSNAPITFSVDAADATLLAGVNDSVGTAQLVVRADATGFARACLRLASGWKGRIDVKAEVSVGGAPGGALTYEVLPTVYSPELACGGDQTLWLDMAGTARSWGCNSEGQLGDGTTTDRSQMRRLASVPEVLTSAAFGQAHGLAVTTTGRVLAWGDNYFGQLGDGTTTCRRTPAAVNGLSGVVQVAAGDCHSLALCADGTVWTWGGNQSGQLGDGSRENRTMPVRVSGLANIVRIAAGARHGLALAADGTVWAWGSNEFGQLGAAAVVDRPTPATVSGVDDVVALASGRQHVLALRADGTVWAWGDNHAGQLGLGSARGQNAPQWIPALPFATGLAAGNNHSAALAADGTFWTWGANDVGQLGNGGGGSILSPAMLALTGVREFAAGWDHVVVFGSDGSLLAWGLNCHDQLGSEDAGGFSDIPVEVASPVD